MARPKRRKSTRRGGRRGNRGTPNAWAKKAAVIVLPVTALGVSGLVMNFYLGIEQADAAHCYQRTDQHKSAIFLDNSVVQLSQPQLRDYRMGFEQAYDHAPQERPAVFRNARRARANGPSPCVADQLAPYRPSSDRARCGAGR